MSAVEGDKDGFPVSSLALTHDKEYLVSCARQSVHFWSVESMFERKRKRQASEKEESCSLEDAAAGSDGDEEGEKRTGKRKKKKLAKKSGPHSSRAQASQFFADL